MSIVTKKTQHPAAFAEVESYLNSESNQRLSDLICLRHLDLSCVPIFIREIDMNSMVLIIQEI